LQDLPKSIKKVYWQNSTYFDDRYSFLPIGIENLRLAVNGLPKYFEAKYAMKNKFLKILSGPYSPTHSEREYLMSLSPGSLEEVDILSGRLSPKKYTEVSSKYLFIAAPRGNGLDTHRFWEALYRGSYPIVLESSWAEEVKKLGIPVITISKWQDEDLMGVVKLEPKTFSPSTIPSLWAPYWTNKIKSELQSLE